ncbi:MAG: hypothetical protein D5R96_02900 [Methanocalculus sp. MSAO_Arc2]|nr:MAG: hypothetical protein D5R96_02900 [Methanocalculus sp. MSAO_Arc2]
MNKVILSRLSIVDYIAEEPGPQYMGGYGTVLGAHEPRLNRNADDLQAPTNRLKNHLEDESR